MDNDGYCVYQRNNKITSQNSLYHPARLVSPCSVFVAIAPGIWWVYGDLIHELVCGVRVHHSLEVHCRGVWEGVSRRSIVHDARLNEWRKRWLKNSSPRCCGLIVQVDEGGVNWEGVIESSRWNQPSHPGIPAMLDAGGYYFFR